MQAEIKHIKEKYATSEDICDLKLEVELLKSSSTSLNHSKKLEGNKQKVPDSCGGRSAEYSVAAAISAEDKAVRTVTHHTPERSGQASKSLHTDAGNKINNAFRETFSHVLQNENKTQNFGTNEWTVVKRKKKLAYNRFAGNRGVATIKPEAKFKAAQVCVPMYIYNVDKEVSEKDIMDYIQEKTGLLIKIEKMIMKIQKEYNSYKIFVPKHKESVLMNDEFWPEGISYRRFIDFKNKNKKDSDIRVNNI
ncbi:unnamed protein product [Danaus chrysippus]|uniref:(African queen) hypothetical protein n=1 Tax=Danaus chrysippus TaxID=151541 RepID=A0A8J2QEG9_9NEOP|nr:unnamed protein product [Danaus chrysippus]